MTQKYVREGRFEILSHYKIFKITWKYSAYNLGEESVFPGGKILL